MIIYEGWRTLFFLYRTSEVIVSRRNYGEAPTRQLHSTPIVVSGSGHTGNYVNSLKLSSIFKTFVLFFFLSSGGWGKIKLKLTTLPRIFIRVVYRFNSVSPSPPHKRFFVGCSSPFKRFTEHLTALRAGASNACLVGENLTCSVPAY